MSNRSSDDRARMKGGIVAIAILLAALALAGCGTESEERPDTDQPAVQTTEVELVTVPDFHEALGTVRSTTRSTVASRLMGTVVSVSVDEGDTVRKGQPLLEIDAREVDAQIRKAEAGLSEIDQAIQGTEAALSAATANYDLARATFNRYESLRERRSVSPQEFDEVEARYKAAAAEQTRIERQLGGLRAKRDQVLADLSTARTYGTWARVTSPVDGVVTAKYVDVGDQASPGMPLVAIDDPSSYRLDVQVDESRLGTIQVGTTVPVRFESLGLETKGRVEAVAPAVDPRTRSALVKIQLSDELRLQSGMFARAYFPTGERQAIVVPTSLIQQRGQLEGVYVLDDSGEPRFRLIRTGGTIGTDTEVLSGLRAGDRVVSEDASSETESSPVAINREERATS